MAPLLIIVVASGFGAAWARERARAHRLEQQLIEALARLSAGGRARARVRREEEARRRDAITAQLKEVARG